MLRNDFGYQTLDDEKYQMPSHSDWTLETHYPKAPTSKTCKKTVSGNGHTSQIDDSYTVFKVFSKVQTFKITSMLIPKWTSGHPK